jgi:3-dehydroquinate synthase
MIKHGIIKDEQLFQDVISCMNGNFEFNEELLIRCIEIKNNVVHEDPLEENVRKILNFGHTIGHVIEGHYMESGISHGHAVAIGMVMEAYLSMKLNGLSDVSYAFIESSILSFYTIPNFTDDDIQAMIEMLSNDKKSDANEIRCCLLEKIGKCTYDHAVAESLFLETLMHFKNYQINMN